ncbi:MAG: ice-binding family protein [Gammaproteobacteria bacterium]
MFIKSQLRLLVTGLMLSLVSLTASATTTCLVPSKMTGLATVAACDFSFTTTPAFACGAPFPQTGTYTIRNNTPVTMKINYIRVRSNDALPASNVTITSNTCGATLARGASCNVTVSLSNAGPFSRILQVGINSRQVELDSPVITPTAGCNVPSGVPAAALLPCALGTTSTFGTLAGTTITNTGPTIINGDLGLFPGTSVTGFPPGTVNGATHITDATAATAKNDLTTLYTCLAARPCGTTIGTGDLAGTTLTSSGVGAQNVYCSGSTINNNGVLTLSGDATSVFIFQAGSALNWNSGATIVLTGGVLARNVFWQVTSSATLGTSTVFKGTIAALTSITMNTGATMSGRALARNAAVTFDTNTVSLP